MLETRVKQVTHEFATKFYFYNKCFWLTTGFVQSDLGYVCSNLEVWRIPRVGWIKLLAWLGKELIYDSDLVKLQGLFCSGFS